MMTKPILFFDSGIGGITTLYTCCHLVPNQQYLYFADESNMPYGNKPKKLLARSINTTISGLINIYNPSVVVLACNTATAVSVGHLRSKFKNTIFIGTEPAVVPALKRYKKVLLLATQNTVKYSKIINLVKQHYTIDILCAKELALFIDNNFKNPQIVKEYLSKLLLPYKNKVDCVVLGCTHYVFFKEYIKQILKVEVLDGNYGVANRLKELVSFFKIAACDKSIRFLNKGKLYNRLVCAYLSLGGKK